MSLLAIIVGILSVFLYLWKWREWKNSLESTQDPQANISKNTPTTYARFRIWYATQNGASLKVAQSMAKDINQFLIENDADTPSAVVLPITEIDVDNFASVQGAEEKSEEDIESTTFSLETRAPSKEFPKFTSDHKVLNVFVVSTYQDGTPPVNTRKIFDLLADISQDFRVSGNHWSDQHFAVFGCGSKEYGKNFNRFALSLHEVLSRKGGRSIIPKVFLSDDNTIEKDTKNFLGKLKKHFTLNGKSGSSEQPNLKDDTEKPTEEADIEDAAGQESEAEDEMINPRIRQGLTKQGYKLFGTHSGVKLCRWTKSMLRGYGGCYKHTFYGISSLACMEMTPSLACANKCVFCWRHHTNPTATSWRWKYDSPEFVVDNALDGHRKMLKVLRGVPGVTEERLREAMKVRHCALSLVGEPIIYPEINKLIYRMHENEISTFLVTNAQFPDKIRELPPVTQLYVSVDAGDKESLKAIDRPVFEDFWDRYLECIRLLSLKKQRTVFRLTLVKNYNVSDIDGYVRLVRLGKPEFIEVKGVTYCGDNGEEGISMRNVPYHHEVVAFCELLKERVGDSYDIACEHEHSCCVLLARKEFKIDGVWHTWINYEKFFELIRDGEPFTSMDYLAPTPKWSVFGAEEKGFDPTQGKKKLLQKGPIAGGC